MKKRWSLHIDDPSSSSGLSALRLELIALGFEEGMDFAIAGWPTPVSSEHYVLSHDADVFIVNYETWDARARSRGPAPSPRSGRSSSARTRISQGGAVVAPSAGLPS